MRISTETLPLTEYLETKVYTLVDDLIEVRIMTYGGIVMEIKVPDKDGKMTDVTLGFSNPSDYVKSKYMNDCPYFGAIIGRYANRIKNGKFQINEHEYNLDKNNGKNHLHGGYRGFDKVIWEDEIIDYFESKALKLSYVSEDGDQGYPGQLRVEVTYYIESGNAFGIDFRATSNATTPINLTWHGYFNLSGEGNGHILEHELQINAAQLTEVNTEGIPTGNILNVSNTPFDFMTPHTIGSRIKDTPIGYDHNYVRFLYGDIPRVIASAHSPVTGIRMTVWTTQPGVQFYSANFLDAKFTGKSGTLYGAYSGFCLETQHFPDSVNNPHFPKTLLEAGEIFQESTIYRFDAK
ncbi:MAG: aldose epimerase family protein [Chloroflexota bacterium]|nr:aldose epimerase family protein [Lentimicrobium sp.]